MHFRMQFIASHFKMNNGNGNGHDFKGEFRGQLMGMLIVQNKTSILSIVYNFILIQLLDIICKKIEPIIEYINEYLQTFYKQNEEIEICCLYRNEWCSLMMRPLESGFSTPKFRGIYKEFPIITNLSPLKKMLLRDDIFICSRINSNNNIEIYITSSSMKMIDFNIWLNNLVKKSETKNRQKYYYTMCLKLEDKEQKTSRISCSYVSLKSNKTFENLFGPHIITARKKLDFFLNNEPHYNRLGIPYTIGFLLYGPPGTGKTSFIKAISNYTQKDIITIDLKIATKSFINNIFFKGKYGKNDNGNEIEINIERSIVVFEDIDCLGSVVLDRNQEINKQAINEEKQINDLTKDYIDPHDKIDLNFLLNILDGVFEIHGRTVIMTSNCPDKLDKALIRPGRIDHKIYCGHCENKTVEDMYFHFFNKKIEVTGFGSAETDCKMLPLEINEIFCSYLDDPEKALEEIEKKKMSSKTTDSQTTSTQTKETAKDVINKFIEFQKIRNNKIIIKYPTKKQKEQKEELSIDNINKLFNTFESLD
jgi:hypothetical protein